MIFLNSLLLMPSLVFGVGMAHAPLKVTSQMATESVTPIAVRKDDLSSTILRRARLQHILFQLDKVAAVAMQMAPERSAQLEPVIVDLAESAIELSTDEALQKASTDAELSRLESTVARLVSVMARIVKPEVSL